MVTQKKGGQKSTTDDATDELARSVPLQAVLLADSFTTKFRPITLDRPKVLLPLVNVPMIDYALSWLESAGVEEVFLFCCSHSRQVASYLENSKWLAQPNFSVKPIESHNSTSAGDAMRFIYEQNVIHGDFVLISGDTVSNMSLTEALQEHKERKKRDSNAVMTMVVKKSKPSQVTHQSRLGTNELYMVIEPSTKQLLHYEDKTENSKGTITLDKAFLVDNSSIFLHNDMQDCYIDICSPEVLSLFADNFDYQHLRRHFVKGLLVDDIMGYKIFTHEIHSSYAARIDNFRSYDIVSKDIIHRWTYPFVPDFKFVGNSGVTLGRQGMYRASDVGLSGSAKIGPFTVIGNGTKIGDNTKVSNSVIGEGCNIGANVSIEGSYIWNNVTIEDGCKLQDAIVCDGVIMKSGAVLEPGVIVSFKVVIREKFVVSSYLGISLHQQPTEEDSDEELEYADNSSGTWEINSTGVADRLDGETMSESSETQTSSKAELGNGGVGYIHPLDWRLSVASIPADKLAEVTKAFDEDMDLTQEDNALTLSGELKPDSNIGDSEDEEDFGDSFDKEVEGTFLRAVRENIKIKDVFLEVNALRLSFNTEAADCAGVIFQSMMKLALKTASGELLKNVASVITSWGELLKFYLPDIDEEIEVILKLEELCFESAKEYAPLFTKILHLLYDKEIIQEEAILRWESEKEDADAADRIFVKQAEQFLQWLKEASEEED